MCGGRMTRVHPHDTASTLTPRPLRSNPSDMANVNQPIPQQVAPSASVHPTHTLEEQGTRCGMEQIRTNESMNSSTPLSPASCDPTSTECPTHGTCPCYSIAGLNAPKCQHRLDRRAARVPYGTRDVLPEICGPSTERSTRKMRKRVRNVRTAHGKLLRPLCECWSHLHDTDWPDPCRVAHMPPMRGNVSLLRLRGCRPARPNRATNSANSDAPATPANAAIRGRYSPAGRPVGCPVHRPNPPPLSKDK